MNPANTIYFNHSAFVLFIWDLGPSFWRQMNKSVVANFDFHLKHLVQEVNTYYQRHFSSQYSNTPTTDSIASPQDLRNLEMPTYTPPASELSLDLWHHFSKNQTQAWILVSSLPNVSLHLVDIRFLSLQLLLRCTGTIIWTKSGTQRRSVVALPLLPEIKKE